MKINAAAAGELPDHRALWLAFLVMETTRGVRGVLVPGTWAES